MTRRHDDAPTVLVVVSAIVVVAGAVMLAAGAWTTGISFDEPYHVLRLRSFFDEGWYLLGDDLHEGAPGAWVRDEYVYAPVTALLLHLGNVVLGNESLGAVSTSPEAYAVRHLGVAVIGVVGVAATAATCRVVMRSWRWGLVGAATLVAVPMWTGHSMFNLKDVPVATGYTLVTLGLVSALRREPLGLPRRAATVLTLAAGIVLALGTRPGAWPGLAAAVVVTLVAARTTVPAGARRGVVGEVVAGLLLAGTALVVVYPEVFADPRWLLGSALVSASYAGPGQWWYVPVQVLGGMPLVLLLLGLFGWVAAVAGGARPRPPTTTQGARLLLVALQALLMPTLAVLRQSHLYDGLRQLLFALPAVVVLLVWGVWQAWRLVREEGQPPALARGVLAVSCVALAVPAVAQAQLFPYNYAYSSVLVDAWRFPTANDYWRTSVRELLPSIPAGEFVVCSPETSESGDFLRHMHEAGRSPVERSRDCRTDELSPFGPYRRTLATAGEPVADTFLAVSTGWRGAGRNCEELGVVDRPRHWTAQTMAGVYRCELVLGAYPPSGVDFDPAGTGSEHLLGGWSGHPAEPGIRLVDEQGSLGFTLDEAWRGETVVVELTTDAPAGTRVLVNNQDVGELRPGAATTAVHVEPPVVAAMGEDRLVITLAAPPGEEPVRLLGVRLSAPQEGPA